MVYSDPFTTLVSEIEPYEVSASPDAIKGSIDPRNEPEGVIRHKTGIIGLKPNDIVFEDNPLLFSCIYHIICDLLGGQDTERRIRLSAWINQCRLEPGNFTRRPGFIDRTISHDELLGLVAFHEVYAEEILEYGEAHDWIWNTRQKDTDILPQYLQRHAFFVFYVRSRAGRNLTIWEQIPWAIQILDASLSRKDSTSGRIMKWLQSLTERNGKHWLIRLAFKFFLYRTRKLYGDISGVFEIYYGASHPFTKALKGIL